jgi:hypothetical protein
MYRPSMYKPQSPVNSHKYRTLGGGNHAEPTRASTGTQASGIAETSDCPTRRSTAQASRTQPS